nr:restriction endonuclease subunit S [uncultured Draconibacterium sp.]
MPHKWKSARLGELVKYVNGGAWAASCYSTTGIPVVRVSDVDNGVVDLSSCKYLDDIYRSKYLKHQLIEEDLIICTVGSHPDQQSSVVGGAGIVSKEVSGAYLNQNAVLLRSNDTKVLSQKWLGYLGKSFIFKNHIENEARGSANQVRIAISNLLNLRFSLPPLPEQQAIASILSALDDKIELNLQMNKTLEEIAMTLYKHWFVDFGPFQDGEFVDSELGPIPKDWEVKKLDDIITTVSKGTTPRRKDVDGLLSVIPFLKVKDVSDDGSINLTNIEKIPNSVHERQLRRSILEPNDILFSIAGTIGRVSIVPEVLDNSNCNQALAFIRLKDKSYHLPLTYFWLKSIRTQGKISSSIVQGVQANVSLTVLKELQLAIPNKSNLISFNALVSPILKSIFTNRAEIDTLSTLRDTLLPKLISGEVRVKDIEKTIAAVL